MHGCVYMEPEPDEFVWFDNLSNSDLDGSTSTTKRRRFRGAWALAPLYFVKYLFFSNVKLLRPKAPAELGFPGSWKSLKFTFLFEVQANST